MRLADFEFAAGAADEGVACLEEAQGAVHFTGDADAHSCAYARRVTNCGSQPEGAIGTEIDTVQALIDVQRSGEASRPSGEICEFVSVTEALHEADAFERLDGAQEHSSTNAGFFGGNVEHVGRSVDEIDVSKSPAQKKRLVSGGLSAEGVAAAIARRVSLNLDNAAAHPGSPGLTHNGFPDEITGEFGGITWQVGARKAPDLVSGIKRGRQCRDFSRDFQVSLDKLLALSGVAL